MICTQCRNRDHEHCPAIVKNEATLCDCGHVTSQVTDVPLSVVE